MPCAGSTSTRRSEAVVSVPVLSTQIVSTDASDSIAFSCCDERARTGHPQRRRGIGDRDEQDRALPGTSVTIPATAVSTAWSIPTSCLRRATISIDPERHHHREQHVEQPVDRALERRARMAELARRPREALGVALGTDRRDLERPGSLDDERPGANLLARSRARPRPTRRSGSTRRSEARSSATQEPVGDDLVAWREADEIALDDLGDVKPARLAVTDDGRLRRHERRQLVELLLGPELLPDPDARVGDDDPEEERVAPVPERQREDAEREQDRVERRERVRADDRRGRAARRRARSGRRAPRGAPQPPPRSGLGSRSS